MHAVHHKHRGGQIQASSQRGARESKQANSHRISIPQLAWLEDAYDDVSCVFFSVKSVVLPSILIKNIQIAINTIVPPLAQPRWYEAMSPATTENNELATDNKRVC